MDGVSSSYVGDITPHKERNGRNEDDDGTNTPHPSTLLHRLKQRLSKTIRSLDIMNGMSEEMKIILKKKIKALAVLILSISLVWWRQKIKSRLLVQSTRHGSIENRRKQKSTKSKNRSDYKNAPEVPLSLLLVAAKKGLVQRACISSSEVAYQQLLSVNSISTDRDNISWNKSKIPQGSPNMTSDIVTALSEGGCLDITALPEPLLTRLAPLLVASSPFIYLIAMYHMLKRLHNGFNNINPTSTDDIVRDADKKTFADVAGVDDAVQELSEIISFLHDPTPFLGMGAKLPRGILLYGPPGCGKTLIARCVANEAKADYFVSCSGSDFVEVYVGQGAKRVRELFSIARREAVHRWRRKFKQTSIIHKYFKRFNVDASSNLNSRPPVAVIFIDEIDTLAKCRDGVIGGGLSLGSGGNDEREQTLNALLTEMDGFNTPQNFQESYTRVDMSHVVVIVIASTNRIQVIDSAILRPGRFDRHVEVGPPDHIGRINILRIHARNMKLEENVCFDQISNQCLNFTGAELKNVVNEAGLMAIRERRKLVCHEDLVYAVKKVKRMKTVRTYQI